MVLAAAGTRAVLAQETTMPPREAPIVYDMSYLKLPPPNPPVPAWAFAMDPPESETDGKIREWSDYFM